VASLELAGIRKTLGKSPILRGIDLAVADGEFAVLVGPSGCGKSTLLRTVAGLEEPDAGRLYLAGVECTRAPPKDRDVAMVFQSYALYPHLTVRDNLAFGLRLRGTSPTDVDARIAEVSEMLRIGALLERFPRDLSGGQRQRVAMGRAIARRPRLFLFDEPLSNLDAALRAEVRVEIKRLHARLGATMLYVTHDQVEAMTLADRLVVLNAGKVEQQGAPLEVYRAPRTRFVAEFLGSPAMNFLPAERSPDGRWALARDLRVPVTLGATAPGSVLVGLRPHDLEPALEDPEVTLVVEVVEAMGFEAYAHGRVGELPFVARLDGNAALPAPGTRVGFRVPPAAVHVFEPRSGERLPAP
jgi:sn-glycerol 3-phosphate transport system ATP-binding protein/multiple sugar transport system ATP-binding protein